MTKELMHKSYNNLKKQKSKQIQSDKMISNPIINKEKSKNNKCQGKLKSSLRTYYL